MSHIVKSKVKVAYTNTEHLRKALQGVGALVENEKLYRVGAGYTMEQYPLVLIDPNNKQHRIGYKLENGVWNQYQENFGSYGRWTKSVSEKIQDRYLAYHYEENFKEEGFDVVIQEHNDGSLELLAEEASW